MKKKKKGGKVFVILSCLFAAAALVFAALTVINFLPRQITVVEHEAQYKLADGANTKALTDKLSAVVSNNYKSAKFPDVILPSLKQAYAVNKNLIGWLTIPGTEVDTAVLWADNNDRYLYYDFYETRTWETTGRLYGSLFLDYRCDNTGGLSKNTVIHGHTTGKSDNVPKQAFRSLYDYRNPDHYKKNPLIKYSTLTGEYTFKICAVFYVAVNPSDDAGYFFNYIYPDMSDSNMTGYIDQVKQRALYETGVSLEPTDKIITLSTCIYDLGKSVDTRLVVLGRLLHEGESESIDTSLVKNNPDFRRPQVWYTRNGKTNPYTNAAKWEPSAE